METELAAILRGGGRDIAASAAAGFVAGYAVFFDITARDLQAKVREDGSPWIAAKGFDTFAPISTGIRAGRGFNPQNRTIRLRVNGVVRQDSNTSQMVFHVPELIAAASRIMTLEAGDVIATGTPAGVWPIQTGDLLEGEIAGVGTLRCAVAARNR